MPSVAETPGRSALGDDARGERGVGVGQVDPAMDRTSPGALTTWPGAESFPSVSGYARPEVVSKLQRLLQQVHAAALVVRQAEQRAASQPLSCKSDGTLLRLAQVEEAGLELSVGVMVLPSSGARYAGQLKAGRMHGSGGLQWPSGKGGAVVVVGEGALATPAMVVAYLGEFCDGIFEGKGRMWLSDGVEFCGEFRDGVRHGWCVLSLFWPEPVFVVSELLLCAVLHAMVSWVSPESSAGLQRRRAVSGSESRAGAVILDYVRVPWCRVLGFFSRCPQHEPESHWALENKAGVPANSQDD